MALTLADLTKRTFKSSPALRTLLLGKRCAGKSFAAGTVGKKTLMIAFTDEDHGIDSAAMTLGDNVTALLVNQIPDPKAPGGVKTADPVVDGQAVLRNILDILAIPGLETQFGAVVFDGHSAFDRYVPSMSDVLKADKYKESVAAMEQHLRVVGALKALATKGIDVIATCALNAWINESGETIYEPSLRGAKTVAGITGDYSEVLLVEKRTFEGDDKPRHVFTFNDAGVEVVKKGSVLAFDKDKKPKNGGTRIAAVDLRVNGVETADLPNYCAADLTVIRGLKAQSKLKDGPKPATGA